jgi:hypothetical protein
MIRRLSEKTGGGALLCVRMYVLVPALVCARESIDR